jgi:hypothetical protein
MLTNNNLKSLSDALSTLQNAAAQITHSTAEFADVMKQFASTGARLQDAVDIDTAKISKYKTLNPQYEIL